MDWAHFLNIVYVVYLGAIYICINIPFEIEGAILPLESRFQRGKQGRHADCNAMGWGLTYPCKGPSMGRLCLFLSPEPGALAGTPVEDVQSDSGARAWP